MNEAVVMVGLVISVASIVGTAVWAVSSIKRDTALLRQSIDHLTEEVRELRTSHKQLDERSDDHERRIIHLEAHAPGPGN